MHADTEQIPRCRCQYGPFPESDDLCLLRHNRRTADWPAMRKPLTTNEDMHLFRTTTLSPPCQLLPLDCHNDRVMHSQGGLKTQLSKIGVSRWQNLCGRNNLCRTTKGLATLLALHTKSGERWKNQSWRHQQCLPIVIRQSEENPFVHRSNGLFVITCWRSALKIFWIATSQPRHFVNFDPICRAAKS